jgi:hypothetical protein
MPDSLTWKFYPACMPYSLTWKFYELEAGQEAELEAGQEAVPEAVSSFSAFTLALQKDHFSITSCELN